MEFILIALAMLAGWGIRKKAADIYRIRSQNRLERAMRKQQAAHRAVSWKQAQAIRDDYTEAMRCV